MLFMAKLKAISVVGVLVCLVGTNGLVIFKATAEESKPRPGEQIKDDELEKQQALFEKRKMHISAIRQTLILAECEKAMQQAKQFFEINTARFRAGQVNQWDVSMAELELNNRMLSVATVQQALEDVMQQSEALGNNLPAKNMSLGNDLPFKPLSLNEEKAVLKDASDSGNQKNVQKSLAALQSLKKIIPIAGRSVELTKGLVEAASNRFNRGLADSFEVAKCEEYLSIAKTEFIQYRLDYLLELARLELALGKSVNKYNLFDMAIKDLTDNLSAKGDPAADKETELPKAEQMVKNVNQASNADIEMLKRDVEELRKSFKVNQTSRSEIDSIKKEVEDLRRQLRSSKPQPQPANQPPPKGDF